MSFWRRLFGGETGDAQASPKVAESRGISTLSPEELERVGAEDDPLRDYEAALERNIEALEAERRGDVDRAVALYEESVAGGFVRSQPYERLAGLYEQRRNHAAALRTVEAFIRLAGSGTLPRGAQSSADRQLPAMEERAGRYRRLLEDDTALP